MLPVPPLVISWVLFLVYFVALWVEGVAVDNGHCAPSRCLGEGLYFAYALFVGSAINHMYEDNILLITTYLRWSC